MLGFLRHPKPTELAGSVQECARWDVHDFMKGGREENWARFIFIRSSRSLNRLQHQIEHPFRITFLGSMPDNQMFAAFGGDYDVGLGLKADVVGGAV